ncbi:MAG: acyl dehydratase [bacterium]|nr:acyl dehydratase [bacterium]MCP5045143.1 acyl dehydratase [bacterium]
MNSIQYQDTSVGDALPEEKVEITSSLIVGGAVASQDFTPVHHDRGAAQASGMQDVFMNILTTNGLCERFVTDWAGPDAQVRKVAIKLGTPNLPGETMAMTGSIKERDDTEKTVVVELAGKNAWGNHVTGTITVALP